MPPTSPWEARGDTIFTIVKYIDAKLNEPMQSSSKEKRKGKKKL